MNGIKLVVATLFPPISIIGGLIVILYREELSNWYSKNSVTYRVDLKTKSPWYRELTYALTALIGCWLLLIGLFLFAKYIGPVLFNLILKIVLISLFSNFIGAFLSMLVIMFLLTCENAVDR
jgi:hypothetical protein